MRNTIAMLLGFLALLVYAPAWAQGDIPVFTWRSHFSYNNIIDITQSDERVYAAAPNGLFFVDLNELSINKLTKIDGLSDVSIGAIGFDTDSNKLVIGYANGNIDLVSSGAIINIETFRDAALIGSKSFHDVSFRGGLAYLSSDQGVLVIDLSTNEIIESYQNLTTTGDRLSVFETAFFGDSIYAATSQGILSASLSATTNRQDFNNWQRALTSQAFTGVKTNATGLFATSNSDLLQFNTNNWQVLSTARAFIEDFSLTNSTALLLTGNALFETDGVTTTSRLDLANSQNTASNLLLEDDIIWIGDGLNGLTRFTTTSQEAFLPNGPSSDDNWSMQTLNNHILLLHGGFSENVMTLGREGVVSWFNTADGWVNTSLSDDSGLPLFDFVDYQLAGTSPDAPAFIASFDRGLISLGTEGNSVVNEVSAGSTLNSASSSVNMTGIAYEEGAIWMTNYGFTDALHRWEIASDTWSSFRLSNSRAPFPTDLFIAPNGDKWLPIDPDRGGGILVFNETSGRERYLTTNGGQGGLPGSEVTSLVLDDDLFLWVGTDDGIAFFPNFRSVLDGAPLTANAPIFENRILLRDEFITSIVVDPGNRKWFGTQTSGLWLFSETGEELVFNFTAENSPLPSNNVLSLTIAPQTGELFIGTDKGTVSFRSDATQGTATHSNVTVAPNPVRRTGNTNLVINGLVNNAQVKITDVSGKLVREIRAQGSTALWNSRDYNGQLVQTGVYLVFSSNDDGTETYVAKIAVI